MQYPWMALALGFGLVLAGCGGGSDAPDPDPSPPPVPVPPSAPLPAAVKNTLTVTLGTLDFMDKPCLQEPDGTYLRLSDEDWRRYTFVSYTPVHWQKALFASMERIYTHGDEVFFIEDYSVQYCQPRSPLGSRVVRLSDAHVSEYVPSRTPTIAIYAPPHYHDVTSGLFWRADGVYALNRLATNADLGFVLQIPELMRPEVFRKEGPRLFRNRAPSGPFHIPVIPSPGAVPADAQEPVRLALVDGSPEEARFHTPHGLVTGRDGVQYFVDNGRLRVIDGDLYVHTLQPGTLRNGERVLDLDADAQGRVHMVAHDAADDLYSWQRLDAAGQGARRDFRIEGFGNPHISMAVKNDVLWLAVRDDALAEKWSTIYRIDWADLDAATGQVRAVATLGGPEIPASAQDYLDNPARYRLPNVRDVHFVGDALWISVAHAVLTIAVD